MTDFWLNFNCILAAFYQNFDCILIEFEMREQTDSRYKQLQANLYFKAHPNTKGSPEKSIELAHESSPHPKIRGKCIDEHQRALGREHSHIRQSQIDQQHVSLHNTQTLFYTCSLAQEFPNFSYCFHLFFCAVCTWVSRKVFRTLQESAWWSKIAQIRSNTEKMVKSWRYF